VSEWVRQECSWEWKIRSSFFPFRSLPFPFLGVLYSFFVVSTCLLSRSPREPSYHQTVSGEQGPRGKSCSITYHLLYSTYCSSSWTTSVLQFLSCVDDLRLSARKGRREPFAQLAQESVPSVCCWHSDSEESETVRMQGRAGPEVELQATSSKVRSLPHLASPSMCTRSPIKIR